MSRYVIMGRENWPGAPIKEICRCDARPHDIKNALVAFKEIGPCGTLIPKYSHVQIMNAYKQKAGAQMKQPNSNVVCIPASEQTKTIANLQTIFAQIDAMRADNGKQAAQGSAAQARPTLPIGQSEAEP